MIEIVSGSLDQSKEELKKILAKEQKRASEIRKEHPKKERPFEVKKQLDAIDRFLHVFRVSVMAPVRIDEITVNYKTYEQLMKKLKGFEVLCEIQSDKLVVCYRKNNGTHGQLELFDLTKHLGNVEPFPEAKILEGAYHL